MPDNADLKTTIVGGRPPGEGGCACSAPRGIEILIKKAAVDPEFKHILIREKSEAAKRIMLDLDPGEIAILDSIPEKQLENMVRATHVSPMLKPAFMTAAASVMLAALTANFAYSDNAAQDKQKTYEEQIEEQKLLLESCKGTRPGTESIWQTSQKQKINLKLSELNGKLADAEKELDAAEKDLQKNIEDIAVLEAELERNYQQQTLKRESLAKLIDEKIELNNHNPRPDKKIDGLIMQILSEKEKLNKLQDKRFLIKNQLTEMNQQKLINHDKVKIAEMKVISIEKDITANRESLKNL